MYKARCCYPPGPGPYGQEIEELYVGDDSPPEALAAALDALLLADGPPLCALGLDFCQLEPWRLACGARLAALVLLRLYDCYMGGGAEQALEVLLPQVRAW